MAETEIKEENIEIKLTDKAREYLSSKNKMELVIQLQEVGGGWGTTVKPAVQARAPSHKEKENYKKITLEEIDIYIAEHMLEPDKILQLVIDLTGFWIFKSIKRTRAAKKELSV